MINTKVKPVQLQIRFHPNEKFLPCNKDYQMESFYPVYYNNDRDYAYNGKMYHSMLYFIYFQENGAIGGFSMAPNNEFLGYHSKDIERIKILYDMKTKLPVYVFLSAHAQEGQFYHISDFEFVNGRYMVVYASLNSHSLHNRAGNFWRILGLANDYTSNKGKHIIPILLYDSNIQYTCSNREVYDTKWKRFFLPFYQSNIDKLKQQQKEEEQKINALLLKN